MVNGCGQNNNFHANISQRNSCNSVSDISRPTGCEPINPPLLHETIPESVSTLTPSNLSHQNLPSITTNIQHQAATQGSSSGSMKHQQVSCAVSCIHQSFGDASLNVGQILSPTSQNNDQNLSLNNCETHILVSHQVTPADHQSLSNQMSSNQPNSSNQISDLSDQLHPVSPSLSNSNQHIIVNLMNSAVNQSEISTISPTNDIPNSEVILNHQMDSGVASNMNLTSQTVMSNVNLSHQNMNISLPSALSSASPSLSLSQNFNISSSLPMNLLMPDPMLSQSNAVLTSYSTAGCGNYSPFDSSISWLTDNRNFYDRSYNNSRLGMLENIGLCSPNSVESLSRNSKETGNYSSKCLPSLHDPVQSWLSISSITNQPVKYSDQISPNLNLLHFEQADLQKFDLNHKSSDLKHLNVDCLKPTDLESKSKCSSPKNKLNYMNQVLAVNTEFPDSYDYTIPCINNIAPYSMESMSKYGYSFSKNLDYPPIPEITVDCSKIKEALPPCPKSTVGERGDFGSVMKKISDCSVAEAPTLFEGKLGVRNDCMKLGETCGDIDLDGDGSDESDIIVEDSDSRSVDEDQNEISVDSVKTILIDEEIDFSGATSTTITLRCFICDLSTTTVPATQFIHTNSEFPVTSASKIPVVTKLLEIVPPNLRKYVSVENHFLCCRCFNLIEAVESLEVKLKSVKDILNETLSRTITIVSIRDSKLGKVEMGSLDEFFEPRSPEQSVKNDGKDDPKVYPTTDFDKMPVDPGPNVDPPETTDGSQEIVEFTDIKQKENRITINDVNTLKPKYAILQFPCQECGQSFDSSASLSSHQAIHGIQFSAFCSDCGKGFKSKSKLKQHILIHSGNFNFLCQVCGKLFRQKHHFEDHVLKHSGKFKFHCKTCNKGFMQKSTLRIHLSMHVPHDALICQHCGKKFSNKWNLTAHINFCSKELSFVCKFCSKKFNETRRLDIHVQSVHENNYKFNCRECKKGFMKKSSLEAHMVVHSSMKLFVCQKCGKSYKTLSNLNQHSRVHSVSTQFNCTLCDAKFLRKSNLEAHLNNHKGSKPYKCDECAKIFASEHYLKIHRKQHSIQSKGVVCPDRGKVTLNDLEAHRKSQGEKRILDTSRNQT